MDKIALSRVHPGLTLIVAAEALFGAKINVIDKATINNNKYFILGRIRRIWIDINILFSAFLTLFILT